MCATCRADPANVGWYEGDEVLSGSIPDGARPVDWDRAARPQSQALARVARAMAEDPTATWSEVARRCGVSRAFVSGVYFELFSMSPAERAALALSRTNAVERADDKTVQRAAWREWKTTKATAGHLSDDDRAATSPPRRFVEVELGYGIGCGPSLSQTIARIARAAEVLERGRLSPTCPSRDVAYRVAQVGNLRKILEESDSPAGNLLRKNHVDQSARGEAPTRARARSRRTARVGQREPA